MKSSRHWIFDVIRGYWRKLDRWTMRSAVALLDQFNGWWYSGLPPGTLPVVENYLRERHAGSFFRCLDFCCFTGATGELTVFYKLQAEGILGTKVERWLIRLDGAGNISAAVKAQDC